MPAQSLVTSFRVIPRSSAAKKTPHPRFLFRVLRVFRGQSWFPVENPVIEHVHAQLARAKAHATVFFSRPTTTHTRRILFPFFLNWRSENVLKPFTAVLPRA